MRGLGEEGIRDKTGEAAKVLAAEGVPQTCDPDIEECTVQETE